MVFRQLSGVISLSCVNQEVLTNTNTTMTGAGNLGAVILLYLNHAEIARRSARNNVLSLLKILERVNGFPMRRDGVPLWENAVDIPLTLLTPALLSDYQSDCVKRYQEEAEKDEPSQREAKERALRSSRSTILQAKCLFCSVGESNLRETYRIHGVTLPPCVDEFMAYKPRGRMLKGNYNPPSDDVVKTAFDAIELMRADKPVFLAFWFAAGLGLRRKEIFYARWEHIVEIDGHPWYRGGIGKNGLEICVPFQLRAFEAISRYVKPSGFVIEERSDRPMKRLSAWMRLQGWDTAKTIHELRAWLGSRLYAISPATAKYQMRHDSIETTESHYLRYCRQSRPPQVL